MSLFLLSFFLIYGLLHLYFYLKARPLLTPSKRVRLGMVLFLIFMTSSPVLTRALEHEGFDTAARVLAWTGYSWMGFIFLFLSIGLLSDIFTFFYQGFRLLAGWKKTYSARHRKLTFSLVTVLSLAVCAYAFHEALSIRTEKFVVKDARIPEGQSIRVVQISDVHLGLIVGQGRLEKILAAVRDARPDILVSTGDLVDAQPDHLENLSRLFQEINPRFGKYAVTGNHEFYAGIEESLFFTSNSGFKILRGETVRIADYLYLAGVDDPTAEYMGAGWRPTENEILDPIPLNPFILLLKHRPQVDPGSAAKIALQLSGHFHNGQIFPFTYITRLKYPARAGKINHMDGTKLYVSRGSGTWGPPLRFLAPPEVTVFDLIHSESPPP